MHKVIKVLNNNTVLAQHEEDEVIIMFKGIGFGKKAGETFEVPLHAKTFLMQKNYTSKNTDDSLFDALDPVYLEIAAEILKIAIEQFKDVNTDILVPLADHIFYAVKRMDENIFPSNPFTNDIRLLFPDEYDVALKGKDVIKQYANKDINDDEVGFITLHIHSAITENRVGESMEATQVIHDGIVKLQEDLHITIDVNSISYSRLMNHIKFLLLRMNRNEKLEMDISAFTKERFPFAYEYASTMCQTISKVLNKPLPENEIGYLALHLERILSDAMKS